MNLDVLLVTMIRMIPKLAYFCPRQWNSVSVEQIVKDAKDKAWHEKNLHEALATYAHENKTYTLVLILGLGTAIFGLLVANIRMILRIYLQVFLTKKNMIFLKKIFLKIKKNH